MANIPPSNLIINGLDLTTVFARYISGPKASPTGIIINNQDLCNIFAPYMIGLKASPTGVLIAGGVDLCNVFLPLNAIILISPTNLSLSNVTTSTASLSFSTVSGATSYLATTNTGITGSSLSFPIILEGLAAGTFYKISLQSINNWGISYPTQPINVTTYPVVPSLSSTISDISMTIVYTPFETLTYYTASVTPTLGGSSSIFSSSTGSLSINGLTNNTTYNIVFLASNLAGQSIPYKTSYTTSPGPPTILSTSNLTTTSLSLTFSTSVGASSYLATTTSGITAASTSSPITINGLSSNTSYTITIQSINNGLYSQASNGITTNTLPDPPTSLTSISGNKTQSSIQIGFTPPSGTISGYLATTTSGITAASTSSPITINGLSSNTSYTITIQSINNGTYSSASNGITTITLPDPPTSLTSISGNKTQSSIQISFTPPSGTITGYLATTTSGITAASTSSPITINGLSSNTSYTITIQSINNGTYSSASNGITTNTLPDPPTSLTSISGNTTTSSIQISFTPPSGTITGYLATTTSGITSASTSSPITINGLSSNTSYTITIQSINNGTYSSASNGITRNTLPNPPTSLTSMSGNTTESSIQISFTPPSGTITGYLATTTSGITAASTSSPITINGLSSSTSYIISIQAINNGIYSQASDQITASTTLPIINLNSIALTYRNKTASNFSNNGAAAISDTGQYILIANYIDNYYNGMVSSNYGTSWTNILFLSGAVLNCPSVSGSGKYMSICGGNPKQDIWISNNYGVTWASIFGATNFISNGYCKIASNGESALIIDPFGQAWLFSKDTNGNFSSSSPSVSLHNNVTSIVTATRTGTSFLGGASGSFYKNGGWGITLGTISGNGKFIYFGNNNNYYVSTNSGTTFTTYANISTNGGASYFSLSPYDTSINAYCPSLQGAQGLCFPAMSYDGKYIAFLSLAKTIIYNNNYCNPANWKTISSVSAVNRGFVTTMSDNGSILLAGHYAASSTSSTAGTYLYFSTNFGTSFQVNPGNIDLVKSTSGNLSWSIAIVSTNGNFLFVVDGNGLFYTYKQS
uniref:Fibronectin type-III domain-containing protein n=1 Tax=viral metagenome TaxID=1070528 RepID=A0A6C0JKT8_9ZZZZ